MLDDCHFKINHLAETCRFVLMVVSQMVNNHHVKLWALFYRGSSINSRPVNVRCNLDGDVVGLGEQLDLVVIMIYVNAK